MNTIYEKDFFIKSLIKEIPTVINGITISEILEKSNERDLVTEVDKGLEEFLTEKILEKFPDHTILGEETYDPEKEYDKEHLWVIDPIDGTTNFIKQKNDYCTLIAYFEHGEPMLSYIYEVEKDDLYYAIKGEGVFLNDKKLEKPEELPLNQVLVSADIRRMLEFKKDFYIKLVHESFGARSEGSSGLDGSRVISGRTGAYINFKGGPWDFAPFFLMSKELGLKFCLLNGDDISLDYYGRFIICTERAFEDIYKIYQETYE